jgi:protein-S-isoprenylcysteine O-methyltransferase Ste14
MLTLGLKDNQIGLLVSIGLVVQTFSALISGPITDKLGRRKTTAYFDFISWSIPMVIWAVAQDFRFFLVAALFNGTWRITHTSWSCLLVEEADPKKLVDIYSWIYIAGLLFAEALRLPHLMRRAAGREHRRVEGGTTLVLERLVLLGIMGGIWFFPLLYIVTGWPRRLDYRLPSWLLAPAILVFATSLAIRLQAHRELGRQWSHTLETAPKHALVTSGIYRHLRHPIYVSLVLWAVAQPALLPNRLAGWGGAVAVGLLWLVRVPREEQMMIAQFGDDYRNYMAQTGRLLPRQIIHTTEASTHDKTL